MKNCIIWVRILGLFIILVYTNDSYLEIVALKGNEAEK